MLDLLRIALALTGAPAQRRSSADTIVAVSAAAFTALAVVAALTCAAAALWIGMRPLVGPVGAPLIVAAVLIALALVALALARRALNRNTARVAVATAGSNEALLTEAARLVVAHKVPVLLAAVLAGLAAGTRDK